LKACRRENENVVCGGGSQERKRYLDYEIDEGERGDFTPVITL